MGTFTLTKFKNTNMNYGENKKSIIIEGSGFPVVKKLLESADLYCSLFLSIYPRLLSQPVAEFYTLSTSEDSDKALFFWDLLLGRRSLPPGLDEALPYQIIPNIAMNIPITT